MVWWEQKIEAANRAAALSFSKPVRGGVQSPTKASPSRDVDGRSGAVKDPAVRVEFERSYVLRECYFDLIVLWLSLRLTLKLKLRHRLRPLLAN